MSPGFADHCAQHRGRTQTPCQGEGGGVESRLPVHSRRPEPVFRRLFDFNEESSSHERFFASSLMLMNSLLVTALFEAEVIPFSTSSRTPRQRSPPDPLTSSERSSTWPRSRPRPMVPLRPVRIVRWNPGQLLQDVQGSCRRSLIGPPLPRSTRRCQRPIQSPNQSAQRSRSAPASCGRGVHASSAGSFALPWSLRWANSMKAVVEEAMGRFHPALLRGRLVLTKMPDSRSGGRVPFGLIGS